MVNLILITKTLLLIQKVIELLLFIGAISYIKIFFIIIFKIILKKYF